MHHALKVFAWNVTGVMVVDGRLNLEQHCGLLAEFHHNSPTWIHSCYMLLSYHHSNFGDSDDVTTTEHDCGAATGRRLKISGVMAGMVRFPSDNYKHSTSWRCWRKLNLIVFIRTKLRNHPCCQGCQELIFSQLDARTLSTAPNAHVEMQHAQSPEQKQKRCGNRGGRTLISYLPSSLYFCRKIWFKQFKPNIFQKCR